MNVKNTHARNLENTKKASHQNEVSQYEDLDKAFSDILTDSTHVTFIGCRAAIEQHSLEGRYDAAYVINEAYIQACYAIDQGKVIINYPAWIRLTCYQIIQTLDSFDEDKRFNRDFDPEAIADENFNAWWETGNGTLEQQKMKTAFSMLTQLEQSILQLMVVQELDWREVQTTLVAAGHESLDLFSLTQNKNKALNALEKAYESISI